MNDINLSVNVESITTIELDGDKWKYYDFEASQFLDIPFEDINTFLFCYKDFIKINHNTIINIAAVTLFLETEGIVFINSKELTVKKRFLPFFKLAYNVFHSKKSKTTDSYLNEPCKINKTNLTKVGDVDFKTVKYLVRNHTKTEIFFNDGSIKYFYNPLKFVDLFLKNEQSFFRVNRNTLINLRYLSACQVDRVKRIGSINIEDQSFKISRRGVSKFINLSLTVF